MRSNNNFSPTTPLLSVMLIAIALLIIAILMLVFRDNSGGDEVAQQPEIDQDALVATAITGLSLTQTAFPTLPPTATQLPTATPVPPTETPVPPTPTNTPEPPTATPEPTEEVVDEVEEGAEEDITAESTEIDATEGVTETTPIIATDALTETVDFNDTGGITSGEPITPTVDPAFCTVGPLETEDGCTYDISVGFSVFNPDTGIHDYYLANTGTCDIPANHKLVQITSDLTTATFDTEYTIGGEFFPVGLEPDPDWATNSGEEPPFVFLNFLIPEEPGTYESCWRLADENNNFYGDPLLTEFTVGQ